jgi:hypothetical protein
MLALKAAIRILVLGLGVALLSIPVAFILTFVLAPFWSWLEATTDIESIGHSGPAEWCYLVTFTVVFCSIALPLFVRERRKQRLHSRPKVA